MANHTIRVSNGILDPKHTLLVGSLLGLFLWLIDKTTKEVNGEGLVLNGAPVKYETIEADLGAPHRSVARWKAQLEEAGYIRTAHTSMNGTLRWWVLNSKKFYKVPMPETAQVGEGYATNGIGGMPNPAPLMPNHAGQLDTTETIQTPDGDDRAQIPFENGAENTAKLATVGDMPKMAQVGGGGLFGNPLQPLIDKHGAALVGVVVAHSKAAMKADGTPFWLYHTPNSISRSWNTRLTQYQASLVRKPAAPKNRWQNTGKSDHIKVAEV